MKINELFEAIGTIGSTTDKIQPNNMPKTTAPLAPQSTGTVPTAVPAPLAASAGQTTAQQGQPVQGTTSSTISPQGTIPAGQQQKINPAIQQTMTSTMGDIDKIAAQIAGLKQRQQQMQQQMQKPTV